MSILGIRGRSSNRTPSKAAEYRKYAAQCMRVAASAAGDAERRRWLDMAQQWTKWAELEQKNEDQKE